MKETKDQAPDAQMEQGPQSVTIFRPYHLQPGQKIHIGGGPRRGDWEVIEVEERKIKLRCPVSLRVIECDHFYFFIEEAIGVPWPRQE